MVFIDQAANTIKCHAERLDKDMGSQTPSLWVYLSSQMGTWFKQALLGSMWPQAPCSQQREPRLTHAKTLPAASTEVREHILAQKEIITSQKKERYKNPSTATACLGHYRTPVHSCTHTGYFYLNCHYLNYNLRRKPNTDWLKQGGDLGVANSLFPKTSWLRSSVS